jgi:hypothetical protein
MVELMRVAAPSQFERAPVDGKESELKPAARRYDQAMGKMLGGLRVIFEAIEDGDAKALSDLVELAILAARMVEAVEKLNPGKACETARIRNQWPIVVDRDPASQAAALKRIEHIELGAAYADYYRSFRKARGEDAHFPARIWAKQAVEAIQETQVRYDYFSSRLVEIGELVCSKRWFFIEPPDWMNDAVQLPVFSRGSCQSWDKVIRSLIRQQMPDFHLRPEWRNQRHSAKERGLNQKGEIQNAILDDICEALRTIAPAEPIKETAEIQSPK